MNHTEQRIWLIKELQKEESPLSGYPIPADKQKQKDLLRGLMNVWMPRDYDDEFWKIHDEYLSEENRRAGITDIDELQPISGDKRIFLWQGDMTTLRVNSIVNPANSGMTGCWQILHNCADNVIHSKAGLKLRQTCNCIMEKQGYPEPTGQAKITPAYNLPCEHVIHTVGPIVQGALTKKHEELLASCYKSCLEIAEENHVGSIAFCCISTGVFMFPNQRAAEIAVETVKKWLDEKDSQMKVVFNVFKDIDLEIYDRLLNENFC